MIDRFKPSVRLNDDFVKRMVTSLKEEQDKERKLVTTDLQSATSIISFHISRIIDSITQFFPAFGQYGLNYPSVYCPNWIDKPEDILSGTDVVSTRFKRHLEFVREMNPSLRE